MITVEEAYAIDPATGMVDMAKFQQFIDQQNASLANMRATTQLTPAQQYMQANPDVLKHAVNTAAAEGIAPGADFGARTQQIAQQHFIDSGQAEGRQSFGMPLSNINNPPMDTTPVNTQPINVPVVTMPGSSISGDTTTADTSTVPTMTGPTNFAPAPMPGQLPGYSFTADPNQYARTLGNFGGLLNDTSPFYAGQVPVAPPAPTAPTGGFNFPELQNYPNANYNAGAFPIIYTY